MLKTPELSKRFRKLFRSHGAGGDMYGSYSPRFESTDEQLYFDNKVEIGVFHSEPGSKQIQMTVHIDELMVHQPEDIREIAKTALMLAQTVLYSTLPPADSDDPTAVSENKPTKSVLVKFFTERKRDAKVLSELGFVQISGIVWRQIVRE